MIRLSAALVAGLVAVLSAAAQPTPRPPERALRADPKAKPAPAELAGVWVSDQPSPNGDTVRHHAFHVLDAETAVWTFAQHLPGVRASVTLRGRYEVANGEFRFHVAERYSGDEKILVGDEGLCYGLSPRYVLPPADTDWPGRPESPGPRRLPGAIEGLKITVPATDKPVLGSGIIHLPCATPLAMIGVLPDMTASRRTPGTSPLRGVRRHERRTGGRVQAGTEGR
jgi:hypothetical protein